MSYRRLFLLGEGDRDIGRATLDRKPPCDFEGDLPRLVRRIAVVAGGPERFGYDASTIQAIVSKLPIQGRAMRSGKKSKNLRDAVVATICSDPRPLAVIALIDARVEEVEELREDFRIICESCRTEAPDVPVALGMAIQEVEIWMLADEQSRRAAFGDAIGARDVGKDLESIHDPKSLWNDLAGQAGAREDDVTERHLDHQRRCAWEALRLEVVGRRCPRGFQPFTRDVREVVDHALRASPPKAPRTEPGAG